MFKDREKMIMGIDKRRLEADLAKMLGCYWGWERDLKTMRYEAGWYKITGPDSCVSLYDWNTDLLTLAFETFMPRS